MKGGVAVSVLINLSSEIFAPEPVAETLAYMAFPSEHWLKSAATTLLSGSTARSADEPEW
jgi:hypothetical protein